MKLCAYRIHACCALSTIRLSSRPLAAELRLDVEATMNFTDVSFSGGSFDDAAVVDADTLGGDQSHMPSPISNERHIVWEVLAQFWADTYDDSRELQSFAAELAGSGLSLREIDYGAYRFGMFTYDFTFPRDKAREKVARWLSRPLVVSLVNPIWLIGYAAAVGYLSLSWLPLRRRVTRLRRASPPNECRG